MKNSIVNEKIYVETARLLEPLGYKVVDVRTSDHGQSVDIMVIIMVGDREVTVDDCAKAHRMLYPHFSVNEANRDISLEVSTPGIQRSLRDIHEFSLFASKRCRVYDSESGAWIEGFIGDSDGTDVHLHQAKFDDMAEIHETYIIPYERIHKAKLAYAWEDIS